MFVSLAACYGANWNETTEEERRGMDQKALRAWDLLNIIEKSNSEAAWEELEAVPPKALLPCIMQDLSHFFSLLGIEGKPDKYERLRGMALAIPDWDGWVQWKIDSYRAMRSLEGFPDIPIDEEDAAFRIKLIQNPKYIDHSGYMGLIDLEKFLPMMNTVETVPLVAQFLSFPYRDPLHRGLEFQEGAAFSLYRMQIPGAPSSYDPEDWKDWWRENGHLYQKGADGKIHGPAPTRPQVVNGKMSPPPADVPDRPRRRPTAGDVTPNGTPSGQKLNPRHAPTPQPTPSASVAVASPPAEKRWPLPVVILSGIGGFGVLVFLWYRLKRR